MKNRPNRDRSFRARRAGFTLIELLTVIAIIAILSSIAIVAVPPYLEKAKITKSEANIQTIVQGLSEYSARTDNVAGYPPAYGYILPEARDIAVGSLVDTNHMLKPYTIVIGIHGDENVYQVSRWAGSFDSNRDGVLSLMEYLPIGEKDPATNAYTFSNTLYDGSNTPMSGGVSEVAAQKKADQRPFSYIPFNKRQLAAARKYWFNAGEVTTEADGLGAASFDTTAAELAGRMFFPPPQYDGFVLIGNGLDGKDGGLTSIPAPGTPGVDYNGRYIYHILGLRIAFLATLDLDDNKRLDYDFRARKQDSNPAILPDGTRGSGAFIKVVQ